MASVLDTSVVDDLLPTIDEIRQIADDLGIRQYKVSTVRRTWTGEERGEGIPSTALTELTPAPRVEYKSGLKYVLNPEGRNEEGYLKITELSLANYQEDDLTGGDLARNEEFFWQLEDNHGQGVRKRYYLLSAPPVVDREDTIGWVIYLRRAPVEDCG